MFANKLYTHTMGHILFSHWICSGSQQLCYLSFELTHSCVLTKNTFLLFFFSSILFSFQVISFLFWKSLLYLDVALYLTFVIYRGCYYDCDIFVGICYIFFYITILCPIYSSTFNIFICVLQWISANCLLFNFLQIFLWALIFLIISFL